MHSPNLGHVPREMGFPRHLLELRRCAFRACSPSFLSYLSSHFRVCYIFSPTSTLSCTWPRTTRQSTASRRRRMSRSTARSSPRTTSGTRPCRRRAGSRCRRWASPRTAGRSRSSPGAPSRTRRSSRPRTATASSPAAGGRTRASPCVSPLHSLPFPFTPFPFLPYQMLTHVH